MQGTRTSLHASRYIYLSFLPGFKCKVTGVTGNAALAAAIPPVWCEGNSSACVPGARQMIFWNQLEGDNIFVDGTDAAGAPKSPAYNGKLGFANGELPLVIWRFWELRFALGVAMGSLFCCLL